MKSPRLKAASKFDIRYYGLRNGVIIITVAAFFALLMLRVEAFREAATVLTQVKWWYVAAAACLVLSTFFMMSLSYRALSFRSLPFKQLFIVQISSGFTGKLLPAGTGTMAINVRLLKKHRHTLVEAASVVGINNLMGFLGHMTLLLVMIIADSGSLSSSDFGVALPPYVWFSIFSIAVVLVLLAGLLPMLRTWLNRLVLDFGRSIRVYGRNPLKLFKSYFACAVLTLCYLGVLLLSINGLGLSIGWLQLIVVFTVGVTAASVTPTPGGIGGAEAGFVAALSFTGMTAYDALSVTLLYRLLTYWFPLFPGFIAFQYVVRRRFI